MNPAGDFIKRHLNLHMVGLIDIRKPLPGSERLHRHRFWQINLACAGEIGLWSQHTRQRFCAGDLLVVPPGAPHYLDYSRCGVYRGLTFKFDLTADHAPPDDEFLLVRGDAASRRLIAAVTELCRGFLPQALETPNREFNVPAGGMGHLPLEDMLWGVLRYYYLARAQHRSGGEIFFRLRELIARRNGAPVTVAELAAEAGYSTGHLRVLVRERTGEPTKTFIDKERIAIIRNHLKYTSLNMSELAARLGFCHLLYFNKFFRKYAGLSPLAYRKRCWQEE